MSAHGCDDTECCTQQKMKEMNNSARSRQVSACVDRWMTDVPASSAERERACCIALCSGPPMARLQPRLTAAHLCERFCFHQRQEWCQEMQDVLQSHGPSMGTWADDWASVMCQVKQQHYADAEAATYLERCC